MKKVLLTAMALLTIASTSVFGMYGSDSSWIDFLVHGNQLRARMNQFGFVLGNDMIKGTVGFKSENGSLGSIIDTMTVNKKQFFNFLPTVSAGIGYTSDVFGIGIGYNYTYKHNRPLKGITKNGYGLSVHTPVLAINAVNDSLRIVVPVQIAMKNGDKAADATTGTPATDKKKYMGISMDPQIRYYTGLENFTELRLYVKYGMNQISVDTLKEKAESFGFDFRAYFGATVGDVALKPFIKVTYDTALGAKGKKGSNPYHSAVLVPYGDTYKISSSSAVVFVNDVNGFEHNPWILEVLPTLGLTANSDIVSLYLEAGLGYKAVNTGKKENAGQNGITHGLAWSSYGEIYITPVKDLEWYFEAEIGNQSIDENTGYVSGGSQNVQFNASTGITWYLPAL